MQLTPITIFMMAIFAYALTRVPEKYRPAWTLRLDSWRTWIGLVAIVMAFLIVLTPEIYYLGLLGDSAFFDVLVLALTCQLQVYASRIGHILTAGFSKITRFAQWRMAEACLVMLLIFDLVVSAVRKIAHHWIS